jgi:hypothetical protein
MQHSLTEIEEKGGGESEFKDATGTGLGSSGSGSGGGEGVGGVAAVVDPSVYFADPMKAKDRPVVRRKKKGT